MHVVLTLVFFALLSTSAPAVLAEEAGPTPEDVAFVQGLLKRFGYNPGPIDGICGDLTVAAVRAFHDERDLPLAPGDIEPQAATVVDNLTTAVANHVIRPKTKVGQTYLDALSCDAGAALEIGRVYHDGDLVIADNMLAYAWWKVAEKNVRAMMARTESGSTIAENALRHQAALRAALEASRMNDALVATGGISERERSFAKALADKICPSPPGLANESSHDSRVAGLKATM